MKKNIFTFAFAALIGVMMTACGGEDELSKKLAPESITISGSHSNLIKVADSVKVILTGPTDEEPGWDVQLVVPVGNTSLWSQIKDSYANYFPRTNWPNTQYINSDGVDLTSALCYPSAFDDIISSETYTTQNVIFKLTDRKKKYKDAKDLYEKIAGAAITDFHLESSAPRSTSTSSSKRNSNTDFDDIDIDKAYQEMDKAIEASEKAIKMSKESLEMMERLQ